LQRLKPYSGVEPPVAAAIANTPSLSTLVKKSAASALTLLTLGVLLYAGLHRRDNYMTPEMGLGYWLGIAGSVMMLVLLLYPLRKRFRGLEWLGRVGDVFRIHMVLGIFGPLLVVLHTNFKLGAPNSNVALFAMLSVVASGIIGRFLYAHIHVGLYGRKAELTDLISDAQAIKAMFGSDQVAGPELQKALQRFEAGSLAKAGLFDALRYGGATRRGRRELTGILLPMLARQSVVERLPPTVAKDRQDAALLHLEEYLSAIRKAAAFKVYERMFALWHVMHMPMFFLLIFAALAHVVAVHWY
jgi:hypothetical protein